MTKRTFTWILALAAVIIVSLAPGAATLASAQSNTAALQDSAETLMATATADNLSSLSPTHFDRARKSYEEGLALTRKNAEPGLADIKFKIALDELKTARDIAQKVRSMMPDVLSARQAARDARADSLVPASWSRTEQEFSRAISAVENGRTISAEDAEAIAGGFRVARRDALRTRVLGQVWKLSEEMDRRRAEKSVPVLSLRVHQAISRAEAALAQDNLDLALSEGDKATRLASRTLDIMTHIETASKADAPWESAILPYDDVLDSLASYFGTSLDYSRGVSGSAGPLLRQVRAHEDSLRLRISDLEQHSHSLEQSLSEAQTSLADAQNRVVELERRMSAAEGERSTTRAKLHVTDQIARAQAAFTAGEATVLQNDQGQVVIRLHGLSFASGAAKLSKNATKILDKAILALDEFPNASVSVEAHTDAEGSERSNQQLSESRAKAVSSYLTTKLKLPKGQIGAVGYGESRPIADNDTPSGRARNRRVEIVVTLPG